MSQQTPLTTSTKSAEAPKETMTKAPLMTTVAPTKVVESTRSPYEVVRPRAAYTDNASWNEGSSIAVGHRWWVEKPKAKRKNALCVIIVFFTLIFIVVVALIGVGFHFMLQQRKKQMISPLLKSKTGICREKYPQYAACIVEDPELFEVCQEDDMSPFCVAQLTVVSKKSNGAFQFTPRVEERYSIGDIDFVECGVMHWCKSSSCVRSGLKRKEWWPHVGFMESTEWILRKHEDFTCFKTETNSAAQAWNEIDKITWTCDTSQCEVHEKRAVRAVLAVELRECDLRPDKEHCFMGSCVRALPSNWDDLP